MRTLRTHYIIHFFAFLHALTTVLCQLYVVSDELLLTLLTMGMLLLICVRKGLNVEYSSALMIVVNALCYFLGNEGALLVGKFISSEILVHALVTVVSTELVGWLSLWAAGSFLKLQKGPRKEGASRILWLFVVMLVIFLVRILLVAFSSLTFFQTGTFDYMMEMLRVFFSNTSTIVILFLVEIIFVSIAQRTKLLGHSLAGYTMLAVFILLISVLSAGYVGWWGPREFAEELGNAQMMQLLIIAVVTNVVMFAVIYLVDTAMASRTAFKEEQVKRQQAQFEYLRLKEQVNPHFLFNSLNILECLVEEGKNSEAEAFIHKLAGMYRYLLQNESSERTGLRDEMTFVWMYLDLLMVRFPKGLVVRESVTDEELDTYSVVPCTIQMLVENATKHNVVSETMPLEIGIGIRNGRLTVRNNLQPRLSSGITPSTNVGISYIRQQYLSLTGHEVEVCRDDGYFSVTVPLLT